MFDRTRQMLAAFAPTAAQAMGVALAGTATLASPAAPDLLVAPTRVVLDGERGAEVILNNTGAETETYRVSLELKRMTPDGGLEVIDEEGASPAERQALEMISYAPRRVTLAPNQPQAIRIGVRPPAGLADGEYRAHMLFRGLPDARAVTELPSAEAGGVSIRLTPVYGLSIPIIVRQGRLAAAASIGDVRRADGPDGSALSVHLTRTGERSIYGQLRVTAPGHDEPVALVNGIAIYTELTDRDFALPLDAEAAGALHGPVTVEYLENRDGVLSPVATRTVTLP